MARVADAQTIRNKSFEKQSIEQALAERLYGAYDNPNALAPLRATVKKVLEAMLEGPNPQLKQALSTESGLRVLSKYPPIGVSAISKGVDFDSKGRILSLFRNLSHFSAADCYDVVRLAGEWIEQGGSGAWGGMTSRAVTAAAEIKQAYRPGVPSGAQQARVAAGGRRWDSQALNPVAKVWSDNKEDKSGVLKATHGRDFKGIPAVRDRISADGKLPAPIRKHDSQAVAGRELKRVANNSTVLKIDRLFGLSEMCDISGTTSDVVFALESWGGPHLSAIYYALPLATVVAGAHHSVLEVALALSLNKTINYKIGFYTSLLPKDTVRKGGNCYGNVANSLYWAEQQMYIKELHFLRFYGKENGGLVFERDEIQDLKRSRLFEALRVLDAARTLSPLPGVYELVTLGNRCDDGFSRKHVYETLKREKLL